MNMSKPKTAKSTSKGGAVAYYRVSTREQGHSGLGMAAQRHSVEQFAKGRRLRIIGEYQDVESGSNNDRPGLWEALERCKAENTVLLIAKLDRLSRNASFTMALRDSGVDFVACDMPDANTLSIGIMALMAQQEREMISTRTRSALAALKARGKKLGTPANLTDAAREKAAEMKRREARRYANGALTHAVNYKAAGWTLQAIANTLNESGARTRHGHLYTPTTVRRLLAMAEEGKKNATP